jgi:hypothetical protein
MQWTCRRLAAGVLGLFSAACAAPPPPAPLPPGPTNAETADFATAQMLYRAGNASGNGDEVSGAADTLAQIPREILSRRDPRLFDAVVVCERYRVAGLGAAPPTVDPQLARACQSTERRYSVESAAIRADLQARVAADDLATVAQSAPARP